MPTIATAPTMKLTARQGWMLIVYRTACGIRAIVKVQLRRAEAA